MNKLIVIFIIVLTVISCKTEKKAESTVEEKTGVYEAIFIDVNNTEIPDGINPDVLMEKKLLVNLNLVGLLKVITTFMEWEVLLLKQRVNISSD